jgi:hypothetical protein
MFKTENSKTIEVQNRYPFKNSTWISTEMRFSDDKSPEFISHNDFYVDGLKTSAAVMSLSFYNNGHESEPKINCQHSILGAPKQLSRKKFTLVK